MSNNDNGLVAGSSLETGDSDCIATAVQIRSLSHRYAKDWALHDVSLEIRSGVVTGLLGANGAGKSTLMNILCGVFRGTTGEIYIDGVCVTREPLQAKSRIGFLPQSAPLYLENTVSEYLRYAALLRGVPRSAVRSAVTGAMEKCRISDYSKRLIGSLSGGYRQRVGIAQAIVHDPRLIVLDEPTNGLDPNQILVIRGLIGELAKEHTVVMSSHVLSEIEINCEYIAMIDRGRLVFDGTFDEFSGIVEPTSMIAAFQREVDTELVRAAREFGDVRRLTNSKLQIVAEDLNNASEKLVALSVERGLGLQQLWYERAALEDVFAHLSRQRSRRGGLVSESTQ